MTEIAINLSTTGDDTAVLSWRAGDTDPVLLTRLITDACEQAYAEGVRRLEVRLGSDDAGGRHALFRAGFRLEGRRRQALHDASGELVDELIFARLAEDVVTGPHGFSAVANSLTPRKRLIAHVLMRHADGRVLLCDTHFKADWELPGGIVEPDEPPRTAAIREVREELGVDIVPGPLLAIDWMPPYLGWEDACELIFDAGAVTEREVAGFTLDQREIKAALLVEPADAEPHLTPLAFRRLSAILAAEPGNTLVMENGVPVAPHPAR